MSVPVLCEVNMKTKRIPPRPQEEKDPPPTPHTRSTLHTKIARAGTWLLFLNLLVRSRERACRLALSNRAYLRTTSLTQPTTPVPHTYQEGN